MGDKRKKYRIFILLKLFGLMIRLLRSSSGAGFLAASFLAAGLALDARLAVTFISV